MCSKSEEGSILQKKSLQKKFQVVFAVNTPPTRKLRYVKVGGGIYGVSCEIEIFGTTSQKKYRNLHVKSLNHGGGIYGVENLDSQISLNHGGVFTMEGVFTANTTVLENTEDLRTLLITVNPSIHLPAR